MISESKFHWQSQNKDTPLGTGKRFIEQKSNGKKNYSVCPGNKKDGYVNYISSIGEKPISMEWEFLGSKLEHGENQNDLMKKICKALNGSPPMA